MLDVPYNRFNKESLYHFYIDYINNYVENLKQNNISGAGGAPSFNYVSLVFDAIKLFPDFQERLQEFKAIQLISWMNIDQMAQLNVQDILKRENPLVSGLRMTIKEQSIRQPNGQKKNCRVMNRNYTEGDNTYEQNTDYFLFAFWKYRKFSIRNSGTD